MTHRRISIRPMNLITSNAVFISDETGNFIDDFRHFLLKDGSVLLKFPVDGSKTPHDIQAIIGRRMIYNFVDHIANSESVNSGITAYFVVEVSEDFDTLPHRYISRKSIRGINFMEFNTGEVERFKGYFTKNKGLIRNIFGHVPAEDLSINDIESLVGEHKSYRVYSFLSTGEYVVKPITLTQSAIADGELIEYFISNEVKVPPAFLVKGSTVYRYSHAKNSLPVYNAFEEPAGIIK